MTTRGGTFATTFLLLAVACRSGGHKRPDPPDPAARLVAEFAGALPLEPRPLGVVREFPLNARESKLPLVDGTTMRVWAYNESVPGPTLRIRLGETLRVRFRNDLPQPTTIHWHGVRVPNAMDGVPNATQPPIAPGETFVYEFTPKDAGTFWYHPHIRSAEQVERGLYGALVVEDEAPPPFSADVVWVLDDWLRDEAGQLIERFVTPHDLAHDGRWGNVVTVNGTTSTQLTAGSADRVRLRLINAANGRVFRPDFRGLDAKIVAVDGTYGREPIDWGKGLEIAPGNRVDLDLRLGSATQNRIEIVDRFVPSAPNHLADIVVRGESAAPTPFASPARAHVPRWTEALGLPVHHEFHLDARRGGPFGIEWTIDGVAMNDHQHDGPPITSLERGKFYRLRFANATYRIHPMHLHGMFFKLLARNGAPVDEKFLRDTVLVHGRETIDIGVVPLDPGRWMMHCHILEHAEAGMMHFLDVR